MDEETQRRRLLAEDQALRDRAMPDLRDISRQKYLAKREQQKLELLQKQIQDEEFLFHGEKLSKSERKQHELNKQVLAITEERMSISGKVEGYHMPEDYITEKGKLDKKKMDAVLIKRYEDTGDMQNFVSEQDQWEKNQVCYLCVAFGVLDTFILTDERLI